MKRITIAVLLLLTTIIGVRAQQFLMMGVGVATEGTIVRVACLAGQLDFSVVTGCNTTWYVQVLK
jgi:hypothetical protein